MEADGFVRRRRMTADTAGGDAGVAGASAGAEIRWIGGRLWGVSETLVGSVSPRIGGETTELQTVSLSGGAPEAANPNPEYEGLSQGSPTSTSTSTHMLEYEGLPSTHTLEYEGLPSTHTLDYEGLPQGASTSTHMLAGAVAGIMEHCLMFPIDCVKTRMQSLQPEPAARYRNVMDALRQIITTEGVWRPMRGLNATAVGAGPAHALYFACYEKVKKTLSDAIHPGANSHVANGVAGCVATLLHDAAMNPAEVVKQRMQMYNSPYGGVLHCVGAVWRREGAAAFYRSYPTQLTMNVPFQALHFVTYEYLQELLNPRRQYRPSSHVLSGAAAGAIAAAVTTPLDVCKTLLNTQEGSGAALLPPGRALGARGHIRGLGHAFRTVYRLGGLPGFFKGVTARVIYQTPSTAISWAVYEFFKYGITQRQEERRRRRGRGGGEE